MGSMFYHISQHQPDPSWAMNSTEFKRQELRGRGLASLFLALWSLGAISGLLSATHRWRFSNVASWKILEVNRGLQLPSGKLT